MNYLLRCSDRQKVNLHKHNNVSKDLTSLLTSGVYLFGRILLSNRCNHPNTLKPPAVTGTETILG